MKAGLAALGTQPRLGAVLRDDRMSTPRDQRLQFRHVLLHVLFLPILFDFESHARVIL